MACMPKPTIWNSDCIPAKISAAFTGTGQMTTTGPADKEAAGGHDAARLPTRAVNLARRALQVERDANGRARVTIELIMIDGQWLITVMRPGKLEHLSE